MSDPRPTRYLVRVYTTDPDGPDDEADFDAPTLEWGSALLADLRKQGRRASLIERRHITPDTYDGMTLGWDFEERTLEDTSDA